MNTGNYEEWLEWRKKYFKAKNVMGRSKPNRIKHSKKKRKSKKETKMDRLMKNIARKEEKMRQEQADAEKYGKVKRGRNRAKDWYSK